MTQTLLTRAALFVALVGVGLAIPADAWAGIIDGVDTASVYYQEVATVAAILAGLWVVDTITWPYLTGQD